MKKMLFGTLAIVFAVALVSFTNAENNSKKFACQWFVFDGVQGTGDHNSVATYAEALDPLNYRPLTGTENINTLCPNVVTLCAICATPTASPVSGKIRPQINDVDQEIKTTIDQYFGQVEGVPAQSPTQLDYPTLIKEKVQP